MKIKEINFYIHKLNSKITYHKILINSSYGNNANNANNTNTYDELLHLKLMMNRFLKLKNIYSKLI